MFSLGEKIVHPTQGAGVIEQIEEKKILGQTKQYYVLKLPCNDLNVMIPVDAEVSVGIRPIVDKSEIAKVIEVLGAPSSAMDSNWNRRNRDNLELLKQGDIMKVAEVVRNLIRVDRAKGLSAGEKKMLANAKQILLSEIILVCEISQEDAVKMIEDAV